MLPTLLKDEKRCRGLIKTYDGIVADFSRQKVYSLDIALSAVNPELLKKQIAGLLSGEHVNVSEDRAALHTELRKSCPREEVADVLDEVQAFCAKNTMRNVVVIGIGGSCLGPSYLHRALKHLVETDKRLFFVSNVDPIEIDSVLKQVDLDNTLFIVTSKTFTTAETAMNASIARDALLESGLPVAQHMVAVSANPGAARAFGIQDVFAFWDWVGGRFSTWSAVGALPISLVYGYDVFERFLRGGESIDKHFAEAPIAENIPAIMGILGCFNVSILCYPARAVLPYSAALDGFVPHVQQLMMESNGKSPDAGEIVFGDTGTNGQHSFYQLLHQGRPLPCDFIAFARGVTKYEGSHRELLHNFMAQPDALALGDPDNGFPGDRPSTALLFRELSPYSLGQLLAIYEHQTAVQGFVWDINSFDQPGVQLGKTLAKQVSSGKTATTSTSITMSFL